MAYINESTLVRTYPVVYDLEFKYRDMLQNMYRLKKSDIEAMSEGTVTSRMYKWMLSEYKRIYGDDYLSVGDRYGA